MLSCSSRFFSVIICVIKRGNIPLTERIISDWHPNEGLETLTVLSLIVHPLRWYLNHIVSGECQSFVLLILGDMGRKGSLCIILGLKSIISKKPWNWSFHVFYFVFSMVSCLASCDFLFQSCDLFPACLCVMFFLSCVYEVFLFIDCRSHVFPWIMYSSCLPLVVYWSAYCCSPRARLLLPAESSS